MSVDEKILSALKQRKWGSGHLTDRVVIVEDAPEVAEALAYVLRRARFDVATAPDGMVGLELVRKNRPKVAIVDLFLPHMSGFELCDTIRRDDRLREMFIIALTGMAEDDEEMAEMRGSADVCLRKPVDVDELVEIVRTAMDAMSSEPGLRRHLTT
ncbi:MAG: response regulator [Candidatus Dadabacteria bacterium]|nr:MAG: response regulator [Candidatus Dadabacteria bacterium]